jgi:hypothetical protein
MLAGQYWGVQRMQTRWHNPARVHDHRHQRIHRMSADIGESAKVRDDIAVCVRKLPLSEIHEPPEEDMS